MSDQDRITARPIYIGIAPGEVTARYPESKWQEAILEFIRLRWIGHIYVWIRFGGEGGLVLQPVDKGNSYIAYGQTPDRRPLTGEGLGTVRIMSNRSADVHEGLGRFAQGRDIDQVVIDLNELSEIIFSRTERGEYSVCAFGVPLTEPVQAPQSVRA
jgi:hypothetical protein